MHPIYSKTSYHTFLKFEHAHFATCRIGVGPCSCFISKIVNVGSVDISNRQLLSIDHHIEHS